MADYRRIVVKVGTSSLTHDGGELDLNYMRSLAQQLSAARAPGRHLALVTSGAIRAGMRPLGLKKIKAIRESQAAAAVGQGLLMRTYSDFFRDEGLIAAQVLLTREDLADRRRYLNARNTLLTLFENQVVPIINENDTVSVDEIRFGDNDTLAAQVASLIDADLLILLTDVAGFYHQAPGADEPQLMTEVAAVTPELEKSAQASSSGVGQGGMTTKLAAAKMAMNCGAAVVIAHARETNVIPRLVAGERIGTFFPGRPRKMGSRKRWIGFSLRPAGTLVVDEGAAQALRHAGKSLLSPGITAVQGHFTPGDVVRLVDPTGAEIGRGLVNYAADEVERIRGHHSREIESILGFQGNEEVIHRDNLTLTEF